MPGRGKPTNIRLGLIGYGSVARAHAQALRFLAAPSGLGGLRLAAVGGPDRARAVAVAAELGAERGAGVDEVLGDPGIDAVILASPSGMHAEQSEAALRAGKHVLCEIPLALSLAAAAHLAQLAAEAQRVLMVCHTYRFQPALMALRERVEAGRLTPHATYVRFFLDSREDGGRAGRARSWTDNLLWHHGGHAIDACLWLLGSRGGAVVAQATAPGPLGISMDMGISVLAQDGALVSATLSYNSQRTVFDFFLMGEEETVVVDLGMFLKHADLPRAGAAHPVARQAAAFVHAIRTGEEPGLSARNLLPTMQVLQAAQDMLDREPPPINTSGSHH
jgi:2-hydroxy-4-carboxymuconate semialdehyde hemiacetal dehydrogenase